MEQQGTTSNTAAGGPTQPETNSPQSPENDAKLAILKPELRCVGFIGMFHDLALLVFLLNNFIIWAAGMHVVLVVKDYDKDDKVNIYCLPDAEVGTVVGFLLAHLIASLLAGGVLAMDFFLRGSTLPGRTRIQTIMTLQTYLILNLVGLVFGLFMSLIIVSYVPSSCMNSVQQFGLMLSHCLRLVCIIIVYKYLTLLGSGLRYWAGSGIPRPFRMQHYVAPVATAQAETPKQEQKV